MSSRTSHETIVEFDSTDHFKIIHKDCGSEMQVKETLVAPLKPKSLKCTYLFVYCESCDATSQRKIYWNHEAIKKMKEENYDKSI